MDEGPERITDVDERAAVRQQAMRVIAKSAGGTALAALLLGLLGRL
jgi:hypothetical protein